MPGLGGPRCVYYEGAAARPGPFQVVLRPFPQTGGPRTIQQAKDDAVTMRRLGTAADRKTDRIIDTPRLGRGAFVHAYLLSGLPDGPVEDVDAYVPKWEIFVNIPTRRLLGAGEVAKVAAIAAAIGR
jgi:hypothetical protein